ncbi:lipase 1-like [Armigeres subalbatus]|uniref:lipase 1-like n=1 Tax=Armigeres subalbatus TaxID=124917 RepID=UPI002ED57986
MDVSRRRSVFLVIAMTIVASADAASETMSNAAGLGMHPQKYQAFTEDGYQLVMYRMQPKLPSRGVVLLQHGILRSSADWLMVDQNLPMQLLESGLDVWLGNSRASPETASHRVHSRDSKPFWDFSFHEIGYYDLAAMIDTVLANSGHRQLHLVGYSEGATAALTLLSERPSYNDKIKSLTLIAPATFMANSQLRRLASLHNRYRRIIPWSLQELVTGSDKPSVISAKQLDHLQQMLLSGRFRQFDYGTWDNQKRYDADSPPPYSLWRITVPVTLHYGTEDGLVPPSDVVTLAQQLHSSKGVRLVKHDRIDHRGFMLSVDAADRVYPRLKKTIMGRFR